MENSGNTTIGSDEVLSSAYSDVTEVDSSPVSSVSTQLEPAVDLVGSGFSKSAGIADGRSHKFDIGHTSYTLVRPLSETTAEAQILLVKGNEKQFVLKHYYQFVKPKKDLIDRLRSVEHPDIIRVLEYGELDGRYFELQEYAAGGSMESRLPVQDVGQIKSIVQQITNALNFCHTQGIVHRDIKPSNIFCRDEKGTDVVLGDFGISSLMDEGESIHRTSFFCTHIYAAPEQSVVVKKETLVSKEVDYYALGITLWHIWTGETPFAGLDELIYKRLKVEGALPLQKTIPEDVRTLIRGLTTPGSIKRWGYDEVQRWLKGERVPVQEEKPSSQYDPFKFGTDESGNKLIGHTPKELAKLIADHPDMGRKHLYRGSIGTWLQKAKNHELFAEVQDIVEYGYPEDEETGTQLAIYYLDPEWPYTSPDGKPCSTKQELLSALAVNFPALTKLLKNPDDPFYLYLTAHGGQKEADVFRKFFKKYTADIALYRVIYSLVFATDKRAPICLRGKREAPDKPSLNAATPKEVAALIPGNTDAVQKRLYSGELGVWLSFRDPEMAVLIEAIVKEYKATDKKAGLTAAMYILDPDMPYTAPGGKICNDKVELGEAVNADFDGFLPRLKDKNSSFYMFLLSRELTGEVRYFRSIFNDGKEEGKITPWNSLIATYKVVIGLDATPTFTFDGKTFTTPDELVNGDAGTRRKLLGQLSAKNSRLNAWLSVFHHEYPVSPDGKKFEYLIDGYQERVKNYLTTIEKINPDNEISDRYRKALRSQSRENAGQRNADNRFVVERLIALVLPVLAAAALTALIVTSKTNLLPDSVFGMGRGYFVFMVIITMVFTFFSMKDDSGGVDFGTGFIGGGIAGLVAAFVLYYVLRILMAAPIALGCVLGTVCLFVVWRILKVRWYTDAELKKQMLESTDSTSTDMEAMEFAFNEQKQYTFSQEQLFDAYAGQRMEMRKKVWKRSAPVTLLFAGFVYLIMSIPNALSPSDESGGKAISPSATDSTAVTVKRGQPTTRRPATAKKARSTKQTNTR